MERADLGQEAAPHGKPATAADRAVSVAARPEGLAALVAARRVLASLGLAALLASGAAEAAPPQDPALEHALRILQKSPVIDGHNDLPWAIRENEKAPKDVAAYDLRARTSGHTDLPRLREGHVGGQFWSVYVPGEKSAESYTRQQLEQIDIARRLIERYPDRLAFAETAADVRRALQSGKIASLLGMEGGHVLENSLGALRAYYDLGARYLTLTHNVTLDWADAANDEPRHGGLTRFGEEVVREMNRLGMLVDLSHVSPEVMEDALRVSEAPVLFSHSSCRALCDVPRNVPDDVLTQLSKNGGLVMITFVPGFVSQEVADARKQARKHLKVLTSGITDPQEKARIEKEWNAKNPPPKVPLGVVADHVEHALRVAGADHIGLGGDFDGTDALPEGLEDVSGYPRLFAELVRRGWSDADLQKLAQGNVLRVLERAEQVAKRLQAERPPTTATIESLDGPTKQ
jgi:membrane dipeptidase